jgi:hypothetical protein
MSTPKAWLCEPIAPKQIVSHISIENKRLRGRSCPKDTIARVACG